MPIDPPPERPLVIEQPGKSSSPIVDMRGVFGRKTPQTEQDRARAQAFIDGKIEMIRHDPHMTDAEKAAAIADLEARRQRP
jgi:hypothetical protein